MIQKQRDGLLLHVFSGVLALDLEEAWQIFMAGYIFLTFLAGGYEPILILALGVALGLGTRLNSVLGALDYAPEDRKNLSF